MTKQKYLLFLLILSLVSCSVFACGWDSDTLAMERSRFPTALELITGKFLRHSSEFYQWRIQDRLSKLQTDPNNLSYYDDLGVAYDKIEQHEKAIQMMSKKNEIKAGLYETEANLGTFLIHNGQLEEGLKHIKKAIQINPNAHFGREKYQMYLVEYVISRRVNGKTVLPLALEKKLLSEREWIENRNRHTGKKFIEEDFASFLQTKNEEDIQAAIKGILGMMKFGNYQSPVLLEALGDLLLFDIPYEMNTHKISGDSRLLASRAYLKASIESEKIAKKLAPQVPDKIMYTNAAPLYKELSDNILKRVRMQDDSSRTYKDKDFEIELQEAEKWYEELHKNEIAWIKENKNPEQEFNKLYNADPILNTYWEKIFFRVFGTSKPFPEVIANLIKNYVSFEFIKFLLYLIPVPFLWKVLVKEYNKSETSLDVVMMILGMCFISIIVILLFASFVDYVFRFTKYL